MLHKSFSLSLPRGTLRVKNSFLNNVHTQGTIKTPYAGAVNDIQTRGKTITTTTGLPTENNPQTPGRYSIKNPKKEI
jgi:hypothetical protein